MNFRILAKTKLRLLVDTICHLRPVQIYWRLWLKVIAHSPLSVELPSPLTTRPLRLTEPPLKAVSFLGGGAFRFLNHTRDFGGAIDWNDPAAAKLWLYNLHYQDYLNQPDLASDDAAELIERWIAANPPTHGNGWEPYPISLRIVNWIKFLTKDARDSEPGGFEGDRRDATLASLYLQSRQLRRHLELHLLGNHLFKNAVALIFAGSYFQGREAEEWLEHGLALLHAELREQVLADGGHFERSPMYHQIILDDVLDCRNILAAARAALPDGRVAATLTQLTEVAGRMLAAMSAMLHPDGGVGFFNDSAHGIASSAEALRAYAFRLGVPEAPAAPDALTDFGLYRLAHPRGVMLVDAGVIGPDFLPGHAHCDTLSYEVSVDGRRLLVNAGTFEYAGASRNLYRSTAAHNTLRLDAAEQHEIWSTFRVARRGYPIGVVWHGDPVGASLKAGHTGYQRLLGGPVHWREIKATEAGWDVVDTVEGQGSHHAEVFLHLHPDVRVERRDANAVVCRLGGASVRIEFAEGLRVEERGYRYSPEFGVEVDAVALVAECSGLLPLRLAHSIRIG